MKRKIIFNENGQALAVALFAVVSTSMAALYMMTQIVNAETALRYPRVKAQQTIQTVRMKNTLNLATVYNCPNVVSANRECTLQTSFVQGVLAPIVGCDRTGYTAAANEISPANNGCGFALRPAVSGAPLLDLQTRRFNAVLHYMGKETSLADTPIDFIVPGQLLTGEIALCPADTPLFQGFDGNGDSICKAFPLLKCGKGQFVSAIDPATFEVTCLTYGSAASCSGDSFLSSLGYSNGNYVGGCVTRINPFIYYDYNPEWSVSKTEFAGGSTTLGSGDYNWIEVARPLAPPPDYNCPGPMGF